MLMNKEIVSLYDLRVIFVCSNEIFDNFLLLLGEEIVVQFAVFAYFILLMEDVTFLVLSLG